MQPKKWIQCPLSLIVNTIAYQRISDRNYYTKNVFPGALSAPSGATGPVIAERLHIHNTAIVLPQEANLAKSTTLNQIMDTLSKAVIISIIDEETVVVNVTVKSKMEHQFETYRNISNQSLNNIYQSTTNHKYI